MISLASLRGKPGSRRSTSTLTLFIWLNMASDKARSTYAKYASEGLEEVLLTCGQRFNNLLVLTKNLMRSNASQILRQQDCILLRITWAMSATRAAENVQQSDTMES